MRYLIFSGKYILKLSWNCYFCYTSWMFPWLIRMSTRNKEGKNSLVIGQSVLTHPYRKSQLIKNNKFKRKRSRTFVFPRRVNDNHFVQIQMHVKWVCVCVVLSVTHGGSLHYTMSHQTNCTGLGCGRTSGCALDETGQDGTREGRTVECEATGSGNTFWVNSLRFTHIYFLTQY